MFPEDMADRLLALPNTTGSGNDVSNARERLISVVGPAGPHTGTTIGGSAEPSLGAERQSLGDPIDVNSLTVTGTNAPGQAARDLQGMASRDVTSEIAKASDRRDSALTQIRHPATFCTQKRQHDELELNETEAAIEFSGPIQKRPRLKYDFWCAEPGCPTTTRQINKMREHMKSGHEDQKVILPRHWRDENGKWQFSERWELQIKSLLERQKKGFTKEAFEAEKKDQATRSPHRSNILTPDSNQPTPPGLSSWPTTSAGAHHPTPFSQGNSGLSHHAPETIRRSSGDPRLGTQTSMYHGDSSSAFPGIGATHAANHGSPTHQDYINPSASQYHNSPYPNNSYPHY